MQTKTIGRGVAFALFASTLFVAATPDAQATGARNFGTDAIFANPKNMPAAQLYRYNPNYSSSMGTVYRPGYKPAPAAAAGTTSDAKGCIGMTDAAARRACNQNAIRR